MIRFYRKWYTQLFAVLQRYGCMTIPPGNCPRGSLPCLQCGGPPVLRCCIKPTKTIVASILNHSDWSYVRQLSYHKSAINPIKPTYFPMVSKRLSLAISGVPHCRNSPGWFRPWPPALKVPLQLQLQIRLAGARKTQQWIIRPSGKPLQFATWNNDEQWPSRNS